MLILAAAIVLEEHIIFRRKSGFDWGQLADRKALAVVYAALTSFLIGWAGAIVGMSKSWDHFMPSQPTLI
jgi:hypothetical protein